MIDFQDQKATIELLKKSVKECEREIIRLDAAYSFDNEYRKHAANLITATDKFAVLALKTQAGLKDETDSVTDVTMIKEMPLPAVCDIKKTEFGYEIFFPSLNGKLFSLGRKHADGKRVRYMLLSLLSRHEDILDKVANPVIVFEHHVDENDKLMASIDSDNLSVKVITDGLQGFVIGDDNVLNLAVMHIGIRDDKSYCKINIIPRNSFPEWVVKHVNLF